MANQLLETYGLGFRALRKLNNGDTDFVVYDNASATTQNIRVYGIIDHNTVGKVHIEFQVNTSDTVITSLDASATNPTNACGMLYFFYKDVEGNKHKISVIFDEFIIESGRPSGKYNLFINGTTQAERLPPLV